jgi:uncharacterized tellurite resistance protein B-like protein
MQEPQDLNTLLDTQAKKLAFFQNLILLAAADGKLDQAESSFLLNIGNRLGISAPEAVRIADNLQNLSFIIPEEGLQKTLELQTLVMMMLEDGQIHEREYSLCRDYTRRIGYSLEMLDEMISNLSGNKTGSQ